MEAATVEPAPASPFPTYGDLEFQANEQLIEDVQLEGFAETIYTGKGYRHAGEEWIDTAERVVTTVLSALGYHESSEETLRLTQLVAERKFIPGGRYLYATGNEYHQTQNCVLFRCEDSREGWGDLSDKVERSLMSGAGVGVVYSDLREEFAPIKKTGGISSGPIAKMHITNEQGRHILQGGSRRSAIWAGLHWWHPDIFKFMRLKNWPEVIKELKAKDPDFPAPMDKTNISVILDTEFFEAYEDAEHPKHQLAHQVYDEAVASMISTGEPGFSIDAWENEGENLRNACTEITSHGDSDVCNLGSVNLGRIETVEEFQEVVGLGTLFLLAGTEYSDVPTDKIQEVREKNRRLGLGLMGVHDWLLKRGYRYEMVGELREWLSAYEHVSEWTARAYAVKHGLTQPKGVRAIAPNGSIGYLGGTTASAEPVFAVAYRREYLDENDDRKVQYVVDPVAARIIEEDGVPEDQVEDAYMLSYDYERRIKFQAELQTYVDHAISSTVNLPEPITDPLEVKLFGDTLMKYLPKLRGITCYPDGARGGQPFTAVPYSYARQHEGVVFEANEEQCKGGACGV